MAGAQLTSAAAFVEGGVQDACEDACSICLETFCENDPATITSCKHEYHLQCILEWSQRSKECPMCWQPLSLKDPASQALLTASEQERMVHHQRSSPFYHRAARDDGEFHRFGMFYGDDSDLEDRIMQHLAAAAMGRAEQFSRVGDTLRFRPSSGHGHPHFMILPAHSNQSPSSLSPATVSPADGVSPSPSTPAPGLAEVQSNAEQTPSSARSSSARSNSISETAHGSGNMDGSRSMESPHSARHRAVESSDGQRGTPSPEPTFADTFKSRWAAASSRVRESVSNKTKGFRGLRAKNAMTDLGTRAREGYAGVVRLVERISLEAPSDANRDNSTSLNSRTNEQVDSPVLSQRSSSHSSDRVDRQGSSSNPLAERGQPCTMAASSVSNSSQPSVIETSCSLNGTPPKVG